jgi:hypothetical protein
VGPEVQAGFLQVGPEVGAGIPGQLFVHACTSAETLSTDYLFVFECLKGFVAGGRVWTVVAGCVAHASPSAGTGGLVGRSVAGCCCGFAPPMCVLSDVAWFEGAGGWVPVVWPGLVGGRGHAPRRAIRGGPAACPGGARSRVFGIRLVHYW